MYLSETTLAQEIERFKVDGKPISSSFLEMVQEHDAPPK